MRLLVLFMFFMQSPNAVIVCPVANMYSKPSVDADVVSQAIYGSNVTILEETEGWLRIRTPDDYSGWIPGTLAKRIKPYGSAERVAMVDSLAAHLYREPSVTKHAPLVTVPFETRLEVVAEPEDEERRWLQVRLPDDRAAWVQRGDLTFETQALDIPAVVTLARRFLGLPYTWGGASSFGYDCSGFTQMLCRRQGKPLPRDARPQAEWAGMVEVSKEELRPGDLLYFGVSEKRITHTGMYIGNGEFIHATAHRKPVIQISRLDEEHWTKLLVAQRRPK